MTAVHKYYSVDEWKAFAQAHPDALNLVTVSSGTSDEDIKRLSGILSEVSLTLSIYPPSRSDVILLTEFDFQVPDISGITIDIANGYQDTFPDTIARVRDNFPNHIIVVSIQLLRKR